MKLTYTFKHMDSSEALVAYAEERLQKLDRYELKPYTIHFNFSMQRHERHCDILITGPDVRLTAHAFSADIYEALDGVIDKLERQLSRRKGRVQHHKRKDVTEEARLDRMTEALEENYELIAPKSKIA